MKLFLTLLLSLGCLIISCEKDNPENCLPLIIDADFFANGPSSELTIKEAVIDGKYLTVKIQAGGCSGDTWELDLVDEGVVLESNPVQRNMRLALKNIEFCEALITKTYCFDLSNLKGQGSKAILNLSGYDENEIIYKKY